jgi:hypothetical protein
MATEEHAILARKFPKVAAAVAKGMVPPFDVDDILRKVNTTPRKKSNLQKKTAAQESIDDDDGDWD